jgi:hypothetical protein
MIIAARITAHLSADQQGRMEYSARTVWMLFIESRPWPMLTLIVSLEAIFLSTFVMIGQNRQATFQQAKADHDFTEEELKLKTNTQLTREIHRLTGELHKRFWKIPLNGAPDSRRIWADRAIRPIRVIELGWPPVSV